MTFWQNVLKIVQDYWPNLLMACRTTLLVSLLGTACGFLIGLLIGDIDLSKTHWEYSADAIALKGFNSIIVGPENGIFNMHNQGIINYIISSNVLPDAAHSAVNMKIALTSDYELGGVTYEKGNVYICSAKSGDSVTWTLYTGTDIAA